MLHNKYFQIMREFLRGYNRKIYGREFIGNVSMSQKNIALILTELEKEGILTYETRGNRKYYSLNFSNFLIENHILLFEVIKKIEFLENNQKIADFLESIKGDILCIFGSYAKGTSTKNSDFDIFAVGKVNSREIIKEGEKYGIKVQLFNLSSSDFRKKLKEKNLLIKEVLNNHIIVKGGENFVKEMLKWIN